MKTKSFASLALYAGAGFITVMWIAFAFVTLNRDVQTWGVFGDKFGALNCWFTGLALVAVLASHLYEREQSAQRDAEQIRILKAMEDQTKAMNQSYLFNAKAHRLDRLEVAFEHWSNRSSGEAVQRTSLLKVEIAKLQEELDRMSEGKFQG